MNLDTTTLPLAGIRVLEFTHAVLGPTAGLILADAGAEVIRIEPAPHGDPTRRLKGFGQGFSPYTNRNKKSIAVNLKTDEGKEIVRKLLETAVVLIENFGPGTMERLGFGYEALKEPYPGLIYCALKGFMPGPYENRMALDEVVQMMSGLAYMTGRPGDPLRAGASVVDIMTGMYGAMAIMLALREREQTGQGQLVKSTLFETAVFLMGQHMAYGAMSGEPVPPMPARVSAWGIYHQFNVANDERVFIGVTSDKQWLRFCDVFGRDEWLADARVATNNGRVAEQVWLLPAIQQMVGKMAKADVIRLCETANLPFSPVSRPEDLFTDPHLSASGGLLQTELPNGRFTQLPRLPIQLKDHDLNLRHQPPKIGQHTTELLHELGYEDIEIERLAATDVIKNNTDREKYG
ncbi:MAG: CoA transferase [Chloroflexi bacterium]|nr:CoA transferase [Chloroflexota bacterium]